MTFEVVYVPFPFTDLSATKHRPCLVLGSCKPRAYAEQLVVAMITSKKSSLTFPHDVEVKNLKSAGLPVPSIIRLSKLVTLDSKLVSKKLGKLDKNDCKIVKQEFRKLFANLVG